MKKLLYTTHNDLSLPYFEGWEVRYYDEADNVNCSADFVYFRDPFNDPDYQPDAAKLNQLIQHYQDAKVMDQITSFQELQDIEDKYFQAQRYGQLYPQTWLPSQHEFIAGKNLAKPRISQRAKDILFELGDRQLDDSWIVQELLDIQEELRVYVVNGQTLPQASIKSSKLHGPVKVIGYRDLTANEMEFVQQAMRNCTLDLAGLDLAILPHGDLKIIEVNRSPQFRRYTENTGINLAELIDNNK